MSAAPSLPGGFAPSPAVFCVGARIDWLTIAFRCRFNRDVLASFVTTADDKPPASAPFAVRAYLARKYRMSSCALALPDGEPGELPAVFRMRFVGEGKTILENGSCVVTLHENAPRSPDDDPKEPGWTLAVQWSGVSLMRAGWREATRWSFRIARALGQVLGVRLRRLDECADMVGLAIPMSEDEGWCTRPQLRSRKMRHAKQAPVARKVRAERAGQGRKLLERFEDGEIDWSEVESEFPEIDETFYYPEGNCTGWRFGKGPINARVYDKPAEMRMRVARTTTAAKRKEEGDKCDAERAWWTAHGWKGQADGSPVRVEVEARGEFLHEIDVRLPAPPVDVHGVCTECHIPHGRGTCPRTFSTARCDMRGDDVVAWLRLLEASLDPVWRYFAGHPDELGRKAPLPTDAEGKCVKCGVAHETIESCRYTRAPKSGWLRQIELSQGARRSECPTTSAWKAVQEVRFSDQVDVDLPQRTRKRGAVRATQALGTVLALLGYVERLKYPGVHDPKTGDLLPIVHAREDDMAKWYATPTEDEQREGSGSRDRVQREVYAQVGRYFAAAGREVADNLNHIYEDEPEEALAMLWTRTNAAIARWKPLAKTRQPPPAAREETA